MSKFQKPCLYEGRQLDNQWMNLIYTSHDLYCGCLKPIKHLEDIVNQQKCRSTKDIGTNTPTKEEDGDEDDFNIDEGDLNKLFEDAETADLR